MAYQLREIGVNTHIKKIVDPNDEFSTPSDQNILRLHFTEILVIAASFYDENNSLITSWADTDTFELAADIDFAHTLYDGTLDNPKSGSITSIEITFASDPGTLPDTGKIRLLNANGEYEAVDYTAQSGTGVNRTFTVSTTLSHSYVAGDVASVSDRLMAFADETQVNITGDWPGLAYVPADTGKKSEGKISFRLDCRRYEFLRKLMNAVANSQGDYVINIEIKRYPTGETSPTVLCQDTIYARNAVRDLEETNVSGPITGDGRYQRQYDVLPETAEALVATDYVDIYNVSEARQEKSTIQRLIDLIGGGSYQPLIPSLSEIGEDLVDGDFLDGYNTSGTAQVKILLSRVWTYIQNKLLAVTAKATPVDADTILINDSVGGDIKDVTFANFEAALDHTNLLNVGTNDHATIDTHLAATNNPHSTSIANIGTGTLSQLNAALTDATLVDNAQPELNGLAEIGEDLVDGDFLDGYNTSGTAQVKILLSRIWTYIQSKLANYITGALGATDNVLVRSDGTGGTTVQGSATTLDDSGNLALPAGGSVATNTISEVTIDNGVSIDSLNIKDQGITNLKNQGHIASTELTISGGSVTATQIVHRIDTEGDTASDDLDTIVHTAGIDILYLRAENAARDIVIKNGTGNIKTSGPDLTLDNIDLVAALLWDDINSNWILVGDGSTAGAAVAWGEITGTLSNQTDLQNALDAKLDQDSTSTEKTISGGVITADAQVHSIDTEGDAGTDDLDTITHTAGVDFIWVRAENAARTVTLKDATGNIYNGGFDMVMDDINKVIALMWDNINSRWLVVGNRWSTGATVNWGDIGGTLSNQTDLQNALNAKQEIFDNLTEIGEDLVDADHVDVYNASGIAQAKALVSRFWTYIQGKLLGVADKATPVAADAFLIEDSVGGDIKSVTYSNLESNLTHNNVSGLQGGQASEYYHLTSGEYTSKILGALGATDNVLVRSDGTGGQTVQGSGVGLDDSDNVTIPAGSSLSVDTVSEVTTDAGVAVDGLVIKDGGVVNLANIDLPASTEKTISGGVITADQIFHTIDTEGDAATDDLDTITHTTGTDVIFIRAQDTARDVVLKDGTGNLELAGADITLDDTDKSVILIYDPTLIKWVLAGYNPSTGIGGSTGATDNAVIRADGTGGSTVQSSLVIIDDSGNLDTPGSVTATSVVTDTINEETATAGVTVDGLLIKDGAIPATGVDINGGTATTDLAQDDYVVAYDTSATANRKMHMGTLRKDINNDQTGTTYTLALTDAGKTVWMNNASANTVTIPTNASVAFPIGTTISVMMEGAGITTVDGDTGVTVNGVSGGGAAIQDQYTRAFLTKRGTDSWVLEGNIGTVA